MVGRATFLPVVMLIMVLSGCAEEYPADEFFIRGHLSIPTNVPMTAFFATPEKTSKIFGRPDVLIKATFKFKDQQQFDEYWKRAQIAQKWNPMPIEDKLYMRMEQFDRFHKADLKSFDRIKDGYWLCETTAGYGFLIEKPMFHPCPPNDVDKDFLLAGLDKQELALYVVLKQDY